MKRRPPGKLRRAKLPLSEKLHPPRLRARRLPRVQHRPAEAEPLTTAAARMPVAPPIAVTRAVVAAEVEAAELPEATASRQSCNNALGNLYPLIVRTTELV